MSLASISCWPKWQESASSCCSNWCLRPGQSLTSATRPTPSLPRAKGESCRAAARARAVRLLLMNASRPSEFEAAFAEVVQQRADALVVSSAVSVLTNPDQIVALAARHSVPAIYASPQSVAIGGLMGYWTNFLGAWRQAGVYTGRILQGEKPADGPVVQATRMRWPKKTTEPPA